MSHAATNWAIQQRGLSPVTKLVLWHLCDRHNPDYGCFPSQDQLAADVEISRASLNVHLEKLESARLIYRQRRHSEDTHRRKSTRYLLAFEAEFGRDPCPESGHGNGQKPCPDFGESQVQNLDTNLVREPVTTTARDAGASGDLEAACLAACGPGLSEAARAEIIATGAVIAGWIAAGYDLAADILPTLADRTRQTRDSPIRTWDYFTPAIAQRHARRIARAATGERAREAGAGGAASAPGPNPDPLIRLAAWINSGTYIPPSAVSTSQRNALLAAGLVTEAALRARQIY
jgi:DNA-binding MarR family transcriptional regulator